MKPFTKISAILFGVMAIVNLLRLLEHFQASIFGNEIPLWGNILGLVTGGVLCLGLWKEAKWKNGKIGKIIEDRHFFADPREADRYFNSVASKRHINPQLKKKEINYAVD